MRDTSRIITIEVLVEETTKEHIDTPEESISQEQLDEVNDRIHEASTIEEDIVEISIKKIEEPIILEVEDIEDIRLEEIVCNVKVIEELNEDFHAEERNILEKECIPVSENIAENHKFEEEEENFVEINAEHIEKSADTSINGNVLLKEHRRIVEANKDRPVKRDEFRTRFNVEKKVSTTTKPVSVMRVVNSAMPRPVVGSSVVQSYTPRCAFGSKTFAEVGQVQRYELAVNSSDDEEDEEAEEGVRVNSIVDEEQRKLRVRKAKTERRKRRRMMKKNANRAQMRSDLNRGEPDENNEHYECGPDGRSYLARANHTNDQTYRSANRMQSNIKQDKLDADRTNGSFRTDYKDDGKSLLNLRNRGTEAYTRHNYNDKRYDPSQRVNLNRYMGNIRQRQFQDKDAPKRYNPANNSMGDYTQRDNTIDSTLQRSKLARDNKRARLLRLKKLLFKNYAENNVIEGREKPLGENTQVRRNLTENKNRVRNIRIKQFRERGPVEYNYKANDNNNIDRHVRENNFRESNLQYMNHVENKLKNNITSEGAEHWAEPQQIQFRNHANHYRPSNNNGDRLGTANENNGQGNRRNAKLNRNNGYKRRRWNRKGKTNAVMGDVGNVIKEIVKVNEDKRIMNVNSAGDNLKLDIN